MDSGPIRNGADRAARWRFAGAAAACAALVIGAYANSLQNAFQFDDQYVVVENVYLRTLRNVPRFFADARTFASFPPNMTYRPLVSTTLALDYAIGGGLARGAFRGDQILQLLVLGALLVAFYARVMNAVAPAPANRYAALFTATLFCVHIVNTETLNLMHVRSELLSTIGLVAAFVVYGLGRARPRRWLSLVPMTVGAFAKIPVVLFAPLLFVWEWGAPGAPSQDRSRPSGRSGPTWRARLSRAARTTAPAFVAAAILYAFVERVMRVASQSYGGYDSYRYALTQAWAWVHYLRLFFLPIGLSADTDLALIGDWYDTRVVVGVAVIGLLVYAAVRCSRRPERWPISFGLAWYMIALLPASSVLPLAEPINEHRAFVANIGLALAVVWAARLALASAFERWSAGARTRVVIPAVACVAILCVHAVGVHYRNRVWRSDESLWADVTAKSPQNGRAWMNYGVALMGRGRWPEARSALARASQLLPLYPHVEINLGITEGATGNGEQAEAHFRRALVLGPNEPTAHYFYARWLVKRGRSPEAMRLLDRAIQLAPADSQAPNLLLELHWARGDDAAAGRVARAMLAIDPGAPRARAFVSGQPAASPPLRTYDSYVRMGRDLARREEHLQAALAFRGALGLQRDGAEATEGLRAALDTLGFRDGRGAVTGR